MNKLHLHLRKFILGIEKKLSSFKSNEVPKKTATRRKKNINRKSKKNCDTKVSKRPEKPKKVRKRKRRHV